MLLQNETLVLRALEPEDLDCLYNWENDTKLWVHGNTLAPYSRYVLRRYIEEAQQCDIFGSKQLRLMITAKDTAVDVGMVDIYDLEIHSKRAGVGILIDEDCRRRGYALQTLKLLKEYCFNFLELHQLYAYIAVDNERSIKLFERAGYILAGTLKDWINTSTGYKDVKVFQLINNSDE